MIGAASRLWRSGATLIGRKSSRAIFDVIQLLEESQQLGGEHRVRALGLVELAAWVRQQLATMRPPLPRYHRR